MSEISAAEQALPPDLVAWFESLGYSDVTVRHSRGICGIYRYMYTGGLVVGMDITGHRGRYCYPSMNEAREALAAWSGEGDPGGAWIKYKGAFEERLGPGCVDDEWGAHSSRQEHAAPRQRTARQR